MQVVESRKWPLLVHCRTIISPAGNPAARSEVPSAKEVQHVCWLSDACIDLEHPRHSLGHQRLRSSGALNRFDSLVLGYELTPDSFIRLVGGLPVERSTDVWLHEHKSFASIKGNITNIFEK